LKETVFIIISDRSILKYEHFIRFKIYVLHVYFKNYEMWEYTRAITQREFRVSCKIVVGNLKGRDHFGNRRRWMGNADRMDVKEIRCDAADCFGGAQI
jgi:hypothetical protein